MLFNIMDHGAVGDGRTNDGSAIQRAIDACHESGGGTVVVPPGRTFMAGPFEILSNVNFEVGANSTVIASLDESLYTESAFKDNLSEGSMWISARDAENISITGTGTIDGQGTEFMLDEEPTHFNYKMVDGVDMRPHLMTMIGCRNVTIRDVTFRNAAYWCLHPIGCQDVVIDGVRILNSLKVRNCDGIDPDHCQNVRISNCSIESADDCICLKTRREYAEYGPTENITVTGCTLKSTSCAIKIGSENVSGIRNVVFNSIIISQTNRGLGVQNRDEGVIENVIFSNITIHSRLFADVWWGKSEPIYVTAYPRSADETRRFLPGQSEGSVGAVQNVHFQNVISESENGVFVGGCAESRPHTIIFDNVRLRIGKTTKYRGGTYDKRPCAGTGLIETDTSGFHLEHCDGVVVRNCSVDWQGEIPEYYGSALLSEDVSGLCIEGFAAESAFPDDKPRLAIEAGCRDTDA